MLKYRKRKERKGELEKIRKRKSGEMRGGDLRYEKVEEMWEV